MECDAVYQLKDRDTFCEIGAVDACDLAAVRVLCILKARL